jgi:small subunit ribosomal protein S16
MLKVRLARIGKRGQPSYRIVVTEARSPRNGKVVDTLGWFNPLVKENGLSLDMVKYQEWIKKGAQPSDSVLRFVLTTEEKEKKWPKVEKKATPAKES